MSRRAWTLAALVLVALAVDVGYVSAFRGSFTVSGDAPGYDKLGLDFAEGHGFPVGGGWQPKREPGYPLFLAAIYRIRGHDQQAVRVVQAALTASFCLLVYALACEIGRGGKLPRAVPMVAAVLTAGYPGFIFYAGSLHRETLFTLFFLLALLAVSRYAVSGRLVDAALFGAAAGLGALVDARLLYFPIFVGGCWLIFRREWRRAAILAAGSFVVALAVISPWTIRNYVVLHRFVLLTTAPYKGLWIATSPEEFLEWDYTREPLKSLGNLPTEVREREMARLARENLVRYPGNYVVSSGRRFVRLWLGGAHSNVMPLMARSLGSALAAGAVGYAALKLTFVTVQVVYVVGGAVGLGLYVWRFGPATIVPGLALLGYLSLVHMVLFATPRYNIPAMPILIIFLAYAAVALRARSSSFGVAEMRA